MAKKPSTDPIYVSRVRSNLKSPNGESYSIELGPKTLLLGRNTSHKSAIVQSVELALTGAVDDIVGRTNVKDSSLLLSLVSGDNLNVSTTTSDNNEASFNLMRGSVADHDGGDPGALVLRQVRSALAGSVASARKTFLSWAAGSIVRSDVLANMPTHLHAKYDDIADKQPGSEVNKLIAVTDYAGKRQRESSKEMRGAQAVLDAGLNNELDSRPTDQDMEATKAAVGKAQAQLETALRADASKNQGADRVTVEAQLDEAGAAIAQWEAESNRLLDQIKQTTPDPTVQQAHDILAWAVSNNREHCPTCNSHVGASHLSACQNAYASAIGGPSQELLDAQSYAVDSMREWNSTFTRLQGILSTMQASDEWTSTLPVGPLIPLEEARSRMAAASAALTSSETARARWDDMARSRDVVASMQQAVDTYKELKKVCESTVGALLDTRSTSFAARVQAYLPDDWVFGIELRDGKKEVFRMGLLNRNGNLHCALSGAEWAAVTTAIAAAIMEIESQRSLSVLIPEDRAWDSKTLASVLRALGAFPGQVIIASTTKPSGRLSGWTVIDMDDWSEEIKMTGSSGSSNTVVGTIEPTKAQKKKSKKMPPPPPEVTIRKAQRPDASGSRILSGLGYDEDQINRMSQETAAELIGRGLFASSVSILRNGNFQVTADNVVPMLPR